MKLSVGYLGRTITLAFALMATATFADAACENLNANFDRAVAARSIDAARHAAADIADDIVCGGRADEFQTKLVNFLIALADAPSTSSVDRERALTLAQDSLDISGTWQTAESLADYYIRRGEKATALAWYEKSVSFLVSRPASRATPSQRQTLLMKMAAAKSLVNDDQEGQKIVAWVPTTRELDGKLGGIYSPGLLRGAVAVAVPLPINFFTAETRFTPEGERAVAELAQAAREQQVNTMKLVGHADPRGGAQYNMDLSRRRVEAVRSELRREGVNAEITIDWKGSRQPFDISVLPYRPSQQEIWALDRRVEWTRDGSPE